MRSLETVRLLLRPFAAQDAEAVFTVIGDAEAMRWYPVVFQRPDADEWIARNRKRYQADGFGLCAVVLKQTGEVIGDCGLTLQDIDRDPQVEVGYHLRRDCWGHGFATEATRRWMNYGFAELRLKQVVSFIRPENLPSRRVAERNGMHLERQIVRAGLVHDVWAITRGEFLACGFGRDAI